MVEAYLNGMKTIQKLKMSEQTEMKKTKWRVTVQYKSLIPVQVNIWATDIESIRRKLEPETVVLSAEVFKGKLNVGKRF